MVMVMDCEGSADHQSSLYFRTLPLDMLEENMSRPIPAITHLQELCAHMKVGDFPLHERDVRAVAKVERAIQQADKECSQVHDILETETIRSGLLRHQLQFFPDSVHKEIASAVVSARQSNADELKILQEKLQSLHEDIKFLDEKQRKLTKQNTILYPERDMVRTQHEEVISQLNQRMADKASKQITLNETRDELRDTNQKIIDLETAIMILKEDMIQERADARREKKHLKQCVHNATKKTKRQKEANLAKKKELDVLKEELITSNRELSDIRKVIRRHESNKARYENQEISFQSQLDGECRENTDLKAKGTELGQNLLQMEKRHYLKKTQLEQSVMEMDVESTNTDGEYGRFEETWCQLEEDVEEASKNQEIGNTKVEDIDSVLQNKKEDLSGKANETARMKQENDEMELRIKQLEENHQVTVQLLSKQIGDFREMLTRERKDRFDLQEKRDNLTRQIDDFKLEFGKFMSEMNHRVNQARQQQEQLTDEGNQLQKNIQSDYVTTEQLHAELQQLQQSFDEMTGDLNSTITDLQTGKQNLLGTLHEKQQQVKENSPAYSELEELFNDKSVEYENKKKHVVYLKNQKCSLEDATARGKREIGKLGNPSVVLKKELKQQRTQALHKMKEQAAELGKIEEDIFQTGRKLTVVTEENEKFKKSITDLKGECLSIACQDKTNSILRGALNNELYLQRDRLVSGWNKEKAMQSESSCRDHVLLDDITGLQERTDERKQKISDVTERLHEELVFLAQFLSSMVQRRPKYTGQGRNPVTPRPPTVLKNYLQQLATQSGDKASK